MGRPSTDLPERRAHASPRQFSRKQQRARDWTNPKRSREENAPVRIAIRLRGYCTVRAAIIVSWD